MRDTTDLPLPTPLPTHFCWTRFGAEAGQRIQHIIERKDAERRNNGGIFLWGIGNAIGPSMRELLLREHSPEVIFSPIKSPPKREDAEPNDVVVWTSGHDLGGASVSLPPCSLVTSRGSSTTRRASRHYALVCYSDSSLRIHDTATWPTITTGNLVNLLSKSPVGASQVTAVVLHDAERSAAGASYPVALRALLVPPYLVELTNPRPISDAEAEVCRLGRFRSTSEVRHRYSSTRAQTEA